MTALKKLAIRQSIRLARRGLSGSAGFILPIGLAVAFMLATSTATIKYSRRERLRVEHYIKHGNQKCETCREGFDFYWIKGVR